MALVGWCVGWLVGVLVGWFGLVWFGLVWFGLVGFGWLVVWDTALCVCVSTPHQVRCPCGGSFFLGPKNRFLNASPCQKQFS